MVDEVRSHAPFVPLERFQRTRMDAWLPEWARRTHPLVRRQLGIFWKVMTPDFTLIRNAYAAQVLFVGLTLVFPALFTLMLPLIVVPVMLLPFALYAYGDTLLRIGAAAAAAMADDRRALRLPLIRSTPYSLREIAAAKGAAAVWRQVEALELLLTTTALLSLPMVIILSTRYFAQLDLDAGPRLFLIGGLTVSLLRLLVEAPMMAALGLLMGAASRERFQAMLLTGLLGFAYFVLINLPRLAPLDLPTRVLVEMILPLVLPVVIGGGAFALALALLRRET